MNKCFHAILLYLICIKAKTNLDNLYFNTMYMIEEDCYYHLRPDIFCCIQRKKKY